MTSQNKIKSLFHIDENITFLNHGSFGSCPKPIFKNLQKWQLLLESQPVDFLDAKIETRMQITRMALSQFINCDKNDIVLFPNPTTAMNEIIKSLNIKPNDEILTTNHEYGAIDKTWEFIADKIGAVYKKQHINSPIISKNNFIDNFFSGLNKKTKIIFISHITSPTGLIFPIKEICKIAKEKKIITIVDGAHVPGHIELNLNKLDVDFYVGACHKWLLCPKGVSFMYVRTKFQKIIKPLIISWGYKNKDYKDTPFQNAHLWQGTNDISNYLTIPSAIKFRQNYNWENVCNQSKKIILDFHNEIYNKINHDPLINDNPKNWLGQMCTFPINISIKEIPKMQKKLREYYKIEIPIILWNKKVFLRISINGYNNWDDINILLDFLKKENLT